MRSIIVLALVLTFSCFSFGSNKEIKPIVDEMDVIQRSFEAKKDQQFLWENQLHCIELCFAEMHLNLQEPAKYETSIPPYIAFSIKDEKGTNKIIIGVKYEAGVYVSYIAEIEQSNVFVGYMPLEEFSGKSFLKFSLGWDKNELLITPHVVSITDGEVSVTPKEEGYIIPLNFKPDSYAMRSVSATGEFSLYWENQNILTSKGRH